MWIAFDALWLGVFYWLVPIYRLFCHVLPINFLGTCAHGKAIKISTKIKALRLSDSGFFSLLLRSVLEQKAIPCYTCWMCLHRLATGTTILRRNAEAEQNVRKKRERVVQNSPSIMLP